jgi:hypothetical protein
VCRIEEAIQPIKRLFFGSVTWLTMAVMIRLIDLYRIVGKRLTKKLLEARWIVPASGASSRGVVFEAEKVHRSLSRLSREGYLLEPRMTSMGSIPPKTPAAVFHGFWRDQT